MLEGAAVETNTYHAGEIAVQERAGERAVAERRGAMIGDRLTGAARAFLDLQGVAAVAAAGPDGMLWASLWCGRSGFLRADAHGEYVEVVAALNLTVAGDPVRQIVQAGASFGMLAIDFSARRRLRINGTISRLDAAGMEVGIRETFGNCIKYIQRRERSDNPRGDAVAPLNDGRTLDQERRDFITRTDTAFVASIHPDRGLDVSHRGGDPGFIHIVDNRTIQIPDYPGNSMFQTLGNFDVDARAGLTLIDFERRRMLALTGRAVAVFGDDNSLLPTGGTGRLWSFAIDRWIDFPLPSTITWTLIDRSPFNPLPPTAAGTS